MKGSHAIAAEYRRPRWLSRWQRRKKWWPIVAGVVVEKCTVTLKLMGLFCQILVWDCGWGCQRTGNFWWWWGGARWPELLNQEGERERERGSSGFRERNGRPTEIEKKKRKELVMQGLVEENCLSFLHDLFLLIFFFLFLFHSSVFLFFVLFFFLYA